MPTYKLMAVYNILFIIYIQDLIKNYRNSIELSYHFWIIILYYGQQEDLLVYLPMINRKVACTYTVKSITYP